MNNPFISFLGLVFSCIAVYLEHKRDNQFMVAVMSLCALINLGFLTGIL